MKGSFGFLIKLVAFTAVLAAAHYYIYFNFFSEKVLYFPLWTIYLFNALLVFGVYSIINYQVSKGSVKAFQTFLGLSMAKMLLIIVFLLPIFMGKSDDKQLEAFNFFIPYFLFLAFEIFALNKFFQNQETK